MIFTKKTSYYEKIPDYYFATCCYYCPNCNIENYV